jgi:hypothetical protein
MWLLLVIILNTGGVEDVEILSITYSEKECLKQKNHAISQTPPETMRLGCLELKGVKNAKGL